MPIIKNKIKQNYSVIPNEILVNKTLKDGDYRLLLHLYQLPQDWVVNQEQLGREFGLTREQINRRIKSLKEQGFLEIEKVKLGQEQWEYIYNLVIPDVTNMSPLQMSHHEMSLLQMSQPTNYYNILNTKDIYNTKDNIKEIYKEKDFTDIIDYLNNKTNSNYKYTGKKMLELIKARLNEGFTLEDFKRVIDNKVNSWGNDDKMVKFLRPETLFSNKFESYLNEKVAFKKKTTKDLDIDISDF